MRSFKQKIAASPSKFCGGTPALWMGINVLALFQFVKHVICGRGIALRDGSHRQFEDYFFYESARSALAATLCALNIGKGDEVIVCAYTCDAVTYAVLEAGATVVYVDVNPNLTMSEECVDGAITENTRAIIVQNTFGKLGLLPEAMERCKRLGILLIEDNALSLGSSYSGIKLGDFGDISIASLEVSKSFTVGWGGLLKINNGKLLAQLSDSYARLPTVSLLSDLRRIAQLFLSVWLIRLRPPGGNYIWAFLYFTKIFRKSEVSHIRIDKTMKRMGPVTTTLSKFILPKIDQWKYAANKNLIEISTFARDVGLSLPIDYNENEFGVSPRLSIMARSNAISTIQELARTNMVEIGRWFSEAPPHYRISDCKIHSSQNAGWISSVVINVPCHWTLSQGQIRSIKNFLESIALIV